MTGSGDAQPPSLRDDEDDHDLLTFGEAGARLQHEIELVQARIADLEAKADIDTLAVAAGRERLRALQAAAARNNRPTITDESFRSFFGYDGRPRSGEKPRPGQTATTRQMGVDMSGLDTSQLITDEASQHAAELHLASRPHKDVSGHSPLKEDSTANPSGEEPENADVS